MGTSKGEIQKTLKVISNQRNANLNHKKVLHIIRLINKLKIFVIESWWRYRATRTLKHLWQCKLIGTTTLENSWQHLVLSKICALWLNNHTVRFIFHLNICRCAAGNINKNAYTNIVYNSWKLQNLEIKCSLPIGTGNLWHIHKMESYTTMTMNSHPRDECHQHNAEKNEEKPQRINGTNCVKLGMHTYVVKVWR